MDKKEALSQLIQLRKEKIRRILANNFETLRKLAGWDEVVHVGPVQCFDNDDRMETAWYYHKDGSITVMAYMCSEIEEDINALNSFLYALAMIRFGLKCGAPIRIVIIGMETSDELVEEFKEINFPFSLLRIRGKKAYFYPSRIDKISDMPSYVEIHKEDR